MVYRADLRSGRVGSHPRNGRNVGQVQTGKTTRSGVKLSERLASWRHQLRALLPSEHYRIEPLKEDHYLGSHYAERRQTL